MNEKDRESMDRFRVELLPNGLYRVFDKATEWVSCFSYDPSVSCHNIRWEHGGMDSTFARMAVAKYISTHTSDYPKAVQS
jgi:hypothetical protein